MTSCDRYCAGKFSFRRTNGIGKTSRSPNSPGPQGRGRAHMMHGHSRRLLGTRRGTDGNPGARVLEIGFCVTASALLPRLYPLTPRPCPAQAGQFFHCRQNPTPAKRRCFMGLRLRGSDENRRMLLRLYFPTPALGLGAQEPMDLQYGMPGTLIRQYDDGESAAPKRKTGNFGDPNPFPGP